MAKDVPFAWPAFWGRQDMAHSHITNMDPVEAGIQVPRKPLVEEIHDNLDGGSEF